MAKGREKCEENCKEIKEEASLPSRQQCVLLSCRISFGARPAGKNESDLVDKVRNVVDHIEEGLVHGSEEVAEQVAKRVDGPANCDNQAHVVEGSGNSLTAAASGTTSFPSEDFK